MKSGAALEITTYYAGQMFEKQFNTTANQLGQGQSTNANCSGGANGMTDYGFTGQRNETSFGLMDFNARYYSPRLGRFVSPDTIVPDPTTGKGFNRYLYANGNPLKYNDPTGHYTNDEIMQHLDCEDWSCVETKFVDGGQYAGLWGWLHILQEAVDGDKITSKATPLDQDPLIGQFMRSASGKIEIVYQSGALSGATPGRAVSELNFAYNALAKPSGTRGLYFLSNSNGQLKEMVQNVHNDYGESLNDIYCNMWDCTAIGLDLAAIGGDFVRAGSPACGWAAPGCYMAGQLTSVSATTYGLARTELAHASGKASDADLAVNRATAIMGFRGQAPIGTSVGGLVQLAWDILDPFHPW